MVESANQRRKALSPKPVFDEATLLQAFEERNINSKHAHKIWRYFLQRGAANYDDVPELPKSAKELLEAEFAIMTSKVVKRTDAADGSTTKLLVELQDGQRIESVIMRYGDVVLDSFPEEEKKKQVKDNDGRVQFKSNKRATLCVSSQVGCSMGCTFCATGTMGLMSNLTSGEILEQLIHANKALSDDRKQKGEGSGPDYIRNIVFMGMGEPLDNYDSVISAIKGMVDVGRFGLSPQRISVSTVGVVPRMVSLIKDAPDVGLALSLHGPTQELRAQIVPTAKSWHIEKIMEAAEAFVAQQNARAPTNNRRRKVLIEYVIIRDVNSSPEVAHQLGRLLQNKDMLLNVIPYNPTTVPFDYKPPTPEELRTFLTILREEYDVHTLMRQEMGQDINSACGQLVIDSTIKKPVCDSENGGVVDMEDLVVSNGSTATKKTVKKTTRRVVKTGNGPVKDDTPRYQHWISVGLAVAAVALALHFGWKYSARR
ncbi:uncharacterized protein BJ171DRAFT_501161 [Polychytrium aggregatum]|uniref:uncharacterized protein n=1 Tax=Polychytrium aggregatum TaxID=110093 RepID=UPI0022FE82EB|nr:uncharacterized protein BJ171DRAFT_501161 [Polychytrium aggregatum]KAI9205671.1 hypothetical protein BJ171DRAFT_501161 [Polychytrium aggregatum]